MRKSEWMQQGYKKSDRKMTIKGPEMRGRGNWLLLSVLISSLPFISISSSWAGEMKCLTVDDFRSFGRCTSVAEVIAKVGKPKEDSCSGVYCHGFSLCDGTMVRLYAVNNSEIQSLKVTKGNEVKEVLISPVMKKVNCSKGKNRG